MLFMHGRQCQFGKVVDLFVEEILEHMFMKSYALLNYAAIHW